MKKHVVQCFGMDLVSVTALQAIPIGGYCLHELRDRNQRSSKEKKRQMSKRTKAASDYPMTTRGSKLASEARKMGNALSDEKRAELLRRGMVKIYGGDPRQTTRSRH